MTYIAIENKIWCGDHWGSDPDPDLYQVDTLEQIEAAQSAMREAGMESADVFASPFNSIEELLDSESGSYDDYKTGQFLSASR